jgi:hypothetical protein
MTAGEVVLRFCSGQSNSIADQCEPDSCRVLAQFSNPAEIPPIAFTI